MSVKVEDLQPQVALLAQRFLSLLKVPYVVTATLRTVEEQMALYAQGRAPQEIVNLLRRHAGLAPTQDSWTVTNCDGINTVSNHQKGLAIDVVPADAKGNPSWPHPSDPRWKVLGEMGEGVGLNWGGRWNKPDWPHFELTTWT